MKIHDEEVTLSAPEQRVVLMLSWVSAVLLGSFAYVLLVRVMAEPPFITGAVMFLAFALPLFVPLRMSNARAGSSLAAPRFLRACAIGAVLAGIAQWVVQRF